MQKLQQLYFIAIVCPEPLQSEITAIKNYFFEKYNCIVALKSPAHISLIPPFELKHHSEDELIPYLQNFKIDIPEIKITLNDFGHFQKRTVFIDIEKSDAMFQLQLALQHHLKQYLLHLKNQSHFRPHITVANRDIKPNEFDEAWSIFREKKFSNSFQCRQFVLLKLTEKKWHAIAEFNWKE